MSVTHNPACLRPTGLCPLQVLITVLHLGRIALDEGWLSVVVASQSVLLWFRLNYFSRVFGSSRFSFLDTLKQARL